MSADHADPATEPPPFRWLWVLIGTILGGALLATLLPVVEALPPRPDVAILVGALTFVLMGVLVGFHSPGRTIAEATVAGGILGVATPLVLSLGFDYALPPATAVLGVGAGIALSMAGGWAGEIMQGTIADGDRESFQWIWVGVGTILGVLLSVYSVFVLNALWDLSPLQTLIFFLLSFFLTAFLVAFFSPGSTVLEPATAAGLVIVVDTLLALAGFRTPFPLLAVVIAIVAAYAIALVGGYLGEVAHNLHFRTAWGGVHHGTAAPKPGGPSS